MEEMKEKSYKNEVHAILQEIAQAEITLSNYRRYADKVRSTEQIILAQIENNVSEYSDMMSKYKDYVARQSFKDGYDGGIIPVDLFELIKQMNTKLQDTYGWKSIQMELNATLLKKMQDVMGDTQALEIKRDALKEMREDNERRNKLFLDSQKENNELLKSLMTARHQLMEDKMNLFMSTVSKEIDDKVKQMHEMLVVFAENVGQPAPPYDDGGFRERIEKSVKDLEKKYEEKLKDKPLPMPSKPIDISDMDEWGDAEKKISKVKADDDDEDDGPGSIPDDALEKDSGKKEDWK